jgi:hypothetical protein
MPLGRATRGWPPGRRTSPEGPRRSRRLSDRQGHREPGARSQTPGQRRPRAEGCTRSGVSPSGVSRLARHGGSPRNVSSNARPAWCRCTIRWSRLRPTGTSWRTSSNRPTTAQVAAGYSCASRSPRRAPLRRCTPARAAAPVRGPSTTGRCRSATCWRTSRRGPERPEFDGGPRWTGPKSDRSDAGIVTPRRVASPPTSPGWRDRHLAPSSTSTSRAARPTASGTMNGSCPRLERLVLRGRPRSRLFAPTLRWADRSTRRCHVALAWRRHLPGPAHPLRCLFDTRRWG